MGFGLSEIFHDNQVAAPLIERKFRWRDLLYATVALPFNMQRQTQTNWCWAATATSTSLFYRPASTWTQCKVASSELTLTCCVNPVPGPCNVPWYLDRALTRTDNFVSSTGPISFSQVETELTAGRVLGARVAWSGGGGHFTVIYGCSTVDGVQYLSIADSIYGNSTPTFATFSNSYQGSGTWTTTYYTKAAPSVSKLRTPELAPRALDPIRKARPLLAKRGPSAEHGEDSFDRGTSFGLAHPVYVLGLRDLVDGNGVSTRPAALRIIEAKDGDAVAFYDVSPGSGDEVLQLASDDNGYADLLSRGLNAAASWVEEGDGEAELRLLRIPGLNVEALLLERDYGGPVAVVIRSLQPDLPLFAPLPLEELLGLLEAPARELLEDDDDLKGS